MVQGISGAALADKVLDCFKDAVHDHSVRVLRSMLITQPQLMDAVASSGLEGSFAEMCRWGAGARGAPGGGAGQQPAGLLSDRAACRRAHPPLPARPAGWCLPSWCAPACSR
jgi:hypothetical protein